jgi:exodeoxyribonuclease V gamma subunit
LPIRSDVDRYLFLEALLSARDYLLIFYQGVGDGDGQPQGPSAVVDELLGYADRAFRLNGELPSEACIRRHPHLSCHSSYFTDKVSNYDSLDYLRAAALYGETSAVPSNPLQPKLALQSGASVVEIDIGDLRATASDPCRFYLRRALGMQIDEEWADGMADDETLALSPLEQHRLVWEALVRPVEEVLEEAAAAGQLPLSPFREVARERLLRSVAEHEARLEAWKVSGRLWSRHSRWRCGRG